MQKNDDIHTLTASEVFGVPAETMDKETRNRAKAVNFGIVYGISAFGLAAQLGIPQAEARAYIERYFARYAGVKAFIEKTLEQTRKEGSVRTMFGRVRPIPDIESRNPNQRGFAERTAINTPLQGTAADLIKLAMIAIDRNWPSASSRRAWSCRCTTNCSSRSRGGGCRGGDAGADGDGRRCKAQCSAFGRPRFWAELAGSVKTGNRKQGVSI